MSAPKPEAGLSVERREELRWVAEAATPGPWGAHDSWAGSNAVVNQDGYPIAICGKESPDYQFPRADRAHIAAFDPPTTIALLDALAAAEAERDEAQANRRANLDDKQTAAYIADLRATLRGVQGEADCTCTGRDGVTDSRGCGRHYLLSLLDEVAITRRERDEARAAVERVKALADSTDLAALSLLLRQVARAHLGLMDGDYWPSDVADAQARAVIAAGYLTPPEETVTCAGAGHHRAGCTCAVTRSTHTTVRDA